MLLKIFLNRKRQTSCFVLWFLVNVHSSIASIYEIKNNHLKGLCNHRCCSKNQFSTICISLVLLIDIDLMSLHSNTHSIISNRSTVITHFCSFNSNEVTSRDEFRDWMVIDPRLRSTRVVARRRRSQSYFSIILTLFIFCILFSSIIFVTFIAYL